MTRLTATLPWTGLGAVAAVAAANWLSGWVLLLVPVLLLGAFGVWQLDPGREFFGCLTGFALLPVLVVAAEPDCQVFQDCDGTPRTVWPAVLAAAALVALGLVVSLRPGSHRPATPRSR